MNAVMSAIGSLGDVLPYVALGGELKRRGHNVTLVANPCFERLAKESAFSFVPVGTLADFDKFLADADLWEPSRMDLEKARAVHYYPLLPDYYRGVTEGCASSGQPVIISNEVGAMAAAEKLDVPLVYLACAPALSVVTQSKYDPTHPERLLPGWARWFAAGGRRLSLLYRLNDLRRRRRTRGSLPVVPENHPVARLRHEVGLPRALHFKLQPRLALCMWPDWFAAPQPDWPKEALVTGFAFHPPPSRPAGQSKTSIAADAPIVVTTGTVAGSQFAFYETAVEACAAVGRPVVLVSPHRNHIPRKLPSTVTWVAHAPFSELFANASLVLHHGGIGTVAYAIAAGVPQIVLPMRWDQFDSGNRLQRLGVGWMLSPKETPAAKLRDTMRFMLRSRRVAARCRYWQSQVDVEGGVRNAADAIEARC